ncbi:MAG: hypothetical protein AB7J28_15815 [Hyphomonadaceae bacterium]
MIRLNELYAEEYHVEAAKPYDETKRYRYVTRPVFINLGRALVLRVAEPREAGPLTPDGYPGGTCVQFGGEDSVTVIETVSQILAINPAKAE